MGKQSRPKSLLVHHVVEDCVPPPKAPKLADGTGLETSTKCPRGTKKPLGTTFCKICEIMIRNKNLQDLQRVSLEQHFTKSGLGH